MAEIEDILNTDKEFEIDQAVQELFKFDNEEIDIKTKTDLTSNEIKDLTKLNLISEIFDITVLKDLCRHYCLYLISKNRLGRTEIVDIARQKQIEMEQEKNMFKRIFQG